MIVGSTWSETLGEEIRYRVHLPLGHERGRCATAYLLHGRGGDLDAWERVLPVFDDLADRGVAPRVVAVMPEAPWSDGGSWYVDSAYAGRPVGRPVETALTRDLVRHVDATYPTVAHRTHRIVGGYSMGGAGALRFLLAHPEVFSGGLALSPATYESVPPAHSAVREFGAFGRGEDRFVERIYREMGHAALLERFDRSFPVRLFLAAGDRGDLDREAAQVHRRAAGTPGVSSRLRVLGGGHDWKLWEAAFTVGLPYVLEGMLDTTEDDRR